MRAFSTSAAPAAVAATARSLKIMFLGAPGAGKGTYASRIAPMLEIPTISTGDLVRHEIKTGTHIGEQIKAYNDRGALVPDQIILDMVEKRLTLDDAKRGFILDGFPRNVPQAEEFQKVVKLDLVVNIDLPQWILTEKISGRRVCTSCGSGFNVAHINHGEYNMPPLLPKVAGVCDKCGTATLVQRPDDSAEIVQQRLEVYNDETAPLIDFYTATGALRTFEVKKGLADLDKLVDLINMELHLIKWRSSCACVTSEPSFYPVHEGRRLRSTAKGERFQGVGKGANNGPGAGGSISGYRYKKHVLHKTTSHATPAGGSFVQLFLSVIWDTTTSQVPANYGQSPLKGLTTISGLNDEPYSDRVIACVLQGRSYLPVTVSDAIALGTTKLIDTTGASINGYRVVKRVMSSLSPAARALYTHSCSTIASTLDAILTRCTLLGYNITSDNLRVVDDIGSSNTYLIENSLSVLVMPYWDSCLTGRFAIPGADGSACMLRLVGTYTSVTAPIPYAVAVNRTAREGKTVEWLKRPGGKWRNGWYEDLEGAKWFSDVTTDGRDDFSPGLTLTQYNMLTGEELVCDDFKKCASMFVEHWGAMLSSSTVLTTQTAVIVSNGKRYGFYQLKARILNMVKTVYDWETLLSNVIAFQILFRWMLAMITLVRGYRLGVSDWHNAGIGCLAHCYSFKFMPFLLLPRLKMTLLAFWTTGCVFEGSQRVLAEAWFVSYPAVVEMVLLYFSLLNFLAKLCRLRVSDAMFGPALIFLCGLHWFREALANSGWLDFDGRVATLISVTKFSEVSILDFFTSSLALHTNGNAKSIFGAKLAAFALGGLLPFLWSLRGCTKKAAEGDSASRIEGILAIRMQNTGGLGRVYPRTAATSGSEHSTEDDAPQAVDGYELIRLGFLVFGDHGGASGNMRNGSSRARRSYLIRVDDWDLLTLMAPMRKLTHLWNYRVKVFALQGSTLGKLTGAVAGEPEMFHIDDRRIQEIHWWEVSSPSLE